MRSLLADLVLIIHFLWVLGILLPIPLIIAGKFRGWQWIRSRPLRWIHLILMAIVMAESAVGMVCPLTVWEQELRNAAGQATYSGSFVEHWVGRLLFPGFSTEVFLALYAVVLVLLITLWIWVPPRSR